MPRLILEPLESPGRRTGRPRLGHLRRQAEGSQDSLHHGRLFNQRHNGCRASSLRVERIRRGSTGACTGWPAIRAHPTHGAEAVSRAAQPPKVTLDAAEHRALINERRPSCDWSIHSVRRLGPRSVVMAAPTFSPVQIDGIRRDQARMRASPCHPCKSARRIARVTPPRTPTVGSPAFRSRGRSRHERERARRSAPDCNGS